MLRRMLILVSVLGLLSLAGCNTPFGTVLVEDDTGQKIGSAWDKNFDGKPDIDPATGEVDLVLPKAAYVAAQQVDEVMPMLLKGAGSLLGVSILTILGVLWKNRKLAAFSVDVVESVQAVRYAVAKDGAKGLLAVVDAALGSQQSAATRGMVAKIKKKAYMAPVVEP